MKNYSDTINKSKRQLAQGNDFLQKCIMIALNKKLNRYSQKSPLNPG
jgi:hypothetical protein